MYDHHFCMQVDEKGWRVVSSYLEMPQHHGKLIYPHKISGSLGNARSRQFDPDFNIPLNDELKRLYTAITRAKSNLWIYDSNYELRLPMFDYWNKLKLVKCVQTHTSGGSEDVYKLVFASNSTPEQWKAQGDNLMERRYFEQALHCYLQAGQGNEYLVKKADAYCLLQRAINGSSMLYTEAALKFLEAVDYCVRSNSLDCASSVELLNSAAVCLWKSQPPRYCQAAQLFDHAGKEEEAAQMYLKGRDYENFVRLREKLGQHDDVVRTLWNKPVMKKRDALAKASKYEQQGIKLPSDLSVSVLSYSCAKFYLKKRDRDTLIEILKYMPEINKRVKCLKEAELYDEAFDMLVEHKQFKDACRLASAQAGSINSGSVASKNSWLRRGLQIAAKNNDEATRASFVFHMAKMEYLHLKPQEKPSIDLIDNLSSLQSSKDRITRAQAHLLLGMLEKSPSHCKSALEEYHVETHKVGELEAFNQLQQLKNPDNDIPDQLLLNSCHLAKETSQTLTTATDFSKELKDAISFYGMQRIGSYYYMSPGQDVWIKEPLMKCVCQDNDVDMDGMVRLEASKVKNELVKHCKLFTTTWLSNSKLRNRLEQKLMSLSLHQQLRKNNHLTCKCTDSKVCTENMQKYLQTSIHMLELQCLNKYDHQDMKSIAMLITIFTPRVSIYVHTPHKYTDKHIFTCLLYTSPSPRDATLSRMPSSA